MSDDDVWDPEAAAIIEELEVDQLAKADKLRLKARNKATAEVAEEAIQIRKVVGVRASSIVPRRHRWLWAGRMPMGELTLMVGRGGAGKSTVMAQMVAWITTGDMKGEYWGIPRDVCYVINEDSLESTVVPRLIAAGADLERVHFLTIDNVGQVTSPMLPVDCDAIAGFARENNAVAVFLDPLSSNMKIDSNRGSEVRPVIERVRAMAEAHGLAVLGLAHMRKAMSSNALDALLGSVELSNVTRSVMAVMADPDEDGAVILSQEKNNLGRLDIASFRYTIETHEFWAGDEKVETGRVRWLTETDIKVSDLLAEGVALDGSKTKIKEAQDWLREYLEFHGATLRSAIQAEARKEGLKDHNLDRAAARLKLVSIPTDSYPRKTLWSLPQQPSVQ